MTKYDMTVIIGKHLNLPIDHIAANTEKPAPGSGTQRPENTELSSKKLEEIGVETKEQMSFDAWWAEYAKDIKGK
jgi:S-adenosylmethionine synthetase